MKKINEILKQFDEDEEVIQEKKLIDEMVQKKQELLK